MPRRSDPCSGTCAPSSVPYHRRATGGTLTKIMLLRPPRKSAIIPPQKVSVTGWVTDRKGEE